MRFQKNIAFLFGVIALITYFSMRNLSDEEIPVMKTALCTLAQGSFYEGRGE